MGKRGKPGLYDDSDYKTFGVLFQTDSKRLIQNNLHKAKATQLLSNYVADGNELPHFDYLLDNEAHRGGKFTYRYKQTVFTELGRLYNYLLAKEDEKTAFNFLTEYTSSLCDMAYLLNWGVRQMEQEIRGKRKEVEQIYKGG